MSKIIFETAYNHQGSISRLNSLVELANSIEEIISHFAIQSMTVSEFCEKEYRQYNVYKEYSIDKEDQLKSLGLLSDEIEPLICALDLNTAKYWVENNFKSFKIHATDISNIELLEYLSQQEVEVYLETQASTLFEIRRAVGILGDKIKCVLHGFSDYPTELEDANGSVMDFLKDDLRVPIGYADHSRDQMVVAAACAFMNLAFVELHVTDSRSNRYFDWQASYTVSEVKEIALAIDKFSKFLGSGSKSLSAKELGHRNNLHKKFFTNKWLRSDNGLRFWDIQFAQYNCLISIAVIARLKSKRLREKVLLPWGNSTIIKYLTSELQNLAPTYLATSDLPEDDELSAHVNESCRVIRDSATSVVDRLLLVAYEAKSKYVVRVTGDNPLTDPQILGDLVSMCESHGLDYARCINVPLGISPEVFRSEKLWKAYETGMSPNDSEYISWLVLEDDSFKKGLLQYTDIQDYSSYRCTVDYEDDYNRCLRFFEASSRKNIQDSLSLKLVPDYLRCDAALLKLPNGKSITLNDYNHLWKSKSIVINKNKF